MPAFFAVEQQPGQARACGQRGHVPAQGGGAALVVQRAQITQGLPGHGQPGGGRLIQPGQGGHSVRSSCSPDRQLQQQAAQIGIQNFGPDLRAHAVFLFFGPEAAADTRFRTPSPPRALGRSVQGDTVGD